jgi:phosphate transport system substrate-binding protein
MTRKSGLPPIAYIVAMLVLVGGGSWFFLHKPAGTPIATSSETQADVPSSSDNGLSAPIHPSSFSGSVSQMLPNTIPDGTRIRIDGSTSMVQINESLKSGFLHKFPNVTVTTNAGGTERGIRDLQAGVVDIAAISRDLTTQEKARGLVAVPVATDAIAVVVGTKNPFLGGLSISQVAAIFQGRITNWSDVGGFNGQIRVFNRPPSSGTNHVFKELVLKNGNFGTTSNIIALQQDATTPLLQALKSDGISYATYTQVAKQQTIRTVPIDGLTPEATSYPFKRNLYYVYKSPSNPSVQAFIAYATSERGRRAISPKEDSN